ncbi:MAG: HPr family phosphocarrier protein [Acidobacteriota bacterium]
MIRRTLCIKNELGLHARAAAKLVRLTSQFESDIKLATPDNGRQVDGKSILGILLLTAARGTEIQVVIDGKDESTAMEAIVKLVDSRFGEHK